MSRTIIISRLMELLRNTEDESGRFADPTAGLSVGARYLFDNVLIPLMNGAEVNTGSWIWTGLTGKTSAQFLISIPTITPVIPKSFPVSGIITTSAAGPRLSAGGRRSCKEVPGMFESPDLYMDDLLGILAIEKIRYDHTGFYCW